MPVSYISARFQAVDDVGRPIVGGRLHTYLNRTTTPGISYSNEQGTTPNTNPVILDASGAATVYLPEQIKYTFVLLDADGVLLWTLDDVLGQVTYESMDAAVGSAIVQMDQKIAIATTQADRAETAANAASLSAGVYPSPAVMITGDANFPPVTNWHYASVPSMYVDGYLDLYQRADGVANYIDTYPNRLAVLAALSTAWSKAPAPFTPYDSDSDESDGAVVDVDGYIIGGYPAAKVLSDLQHNEALVRYAPFDSDEDESDGGIVDPDGYVIGGVPTVLAGGGVQASSSAGPMHVVADYEAKAVSFASWFGSDRWWRVHVSPHGPNEIINVDHFEDVGGSDITAPGARVEVTSTDWIPPRQTRANANGDSTSKQSTGGSHAIGGVQTARTTGHTLIIDGRRLSAGEKFTGYAKEVLFGFTEEVMSYNTVTLGRYTHDVYVGLRLTPLCIESIVNLKAREAITVYRDGGFQMTGIGFQTSGHHYNDTAQARLTASAFLNSAAKADAPNVWATSLYGAGRGFQTSWVDNAYQAGNRAHVANSFPLAYRNGGGTWKFYHAIVEAQDGSFVLQPGESYEYSGGYCWSPEGSQGAADSAFIFTRFGRPRLGYAFLTAGSADIYADAGLIGLETGMGVITPTGLRLTAPGYTTNSTDIKV